MPRVQKVLHSNDRSVNNSSSIVGGTIISQDDLHLLHSSYLWDFFLSSCQLYNLKAELSISPAFNIKSILRWCTVSHNSSSVAARKKRAVNAICKQQRLRPACTFTQSGHSLCCLKAALYGDPEAQNAGMHSSICRLPNHTHLFCVFWLKLPRQANVFLISTSGLLLVAL